MFEYFLILNFFIFFNYINSQTTNIYYNITLLKLKNENCEFNSNNYIFEIECIINPSPIFDLEFDLDLSLPTGMKARSKIIDDVIDVIKCNANSKDILNKEETFSISENKNIKVSDKININIGKLNQNWIAKCNSVNFIHINAYFLIIAIFLLIL